MLRATILGSFANTKIHKKLLSPKKIDKIYKVLSEK